MDHIDRKIIDLLQNNARAPLKEIADHVFLSSPAVSARMARLESSGTITGYQAQVDAPKLGYMVKAFINLDMDPQRKPEFYPYIQSCPHVVECNCVTGDYSMLIEVLCPLRQRADDGRIPVGNRLQALPFGNRCGRRPGFLCGGHSRRGGAVAGCGGMEPQGTTEGQHQEEYVTVRFGG